MAYRVIVIEEDPEMLEEIIATLKRSQDFDVSSTYKTAKAAIGPASMFNPNLLFVNIDSEETLDALETLVNVFPGAYILAMMVQWDPLKAQRAIEAGVTGCLLKPFTAKEVLEYLQLYSIRGKHESARFISFFSPKGRAGRTTLAALLALLIAEKTGERVALIDADLQFGDLPIFFDLAPKRTVVDATQDIKLLTPLTFAPYFTEIKKGVSLLASPDRPEYAELVSPENLVDVVAMTGNIFRYVLIDLPAGFNPLSLNICRMSDVIFVTTMINSGFEINHVKKTLEMFNSQFDDDKVNVKTVFTRVNPFTEDQRLKIELKLGYPVDLMIPNEYRMISIANSGRLSRGLPTDNLLMKSVSDMADKVIAAAEERR